MAYSYITLAQLRAELLNRLQDVGAVYTSTAEANLYIDEALRVLNAQTAAWPFDFQLDFNPGDTWKTLNYSGSPRQRTITDSQIYSQMEAMLSEPMSGSVWTGTNQYNIAMLAGALQYRRDELLLQSAANVVNELQFSPVLTTRTYLPDSTLDLLRVRWIAVDSTTTMPYALGREDVVSRNAFGVNLPIEPGEPDSWMITATTPPAFDVSCPPNQPGQWDMLISVSGAPFVPPASAFVGLPDDWCWVAMYGALADVLANSPEGRDSARAKYCVPLDSEILTRMGWKKYDEVTVGEEVLGYNADTDRCEWTHLLDVTVLRDREVATYDAKPFSVRCTDDHRWVFRRRTNWRSKGVKPERAIRIGPFSEELTDSLFVQAAPAPDGPGLGEISIQEYMQRGKAVEMVLRMTSGERRSFILGLLYGEGSSMKGRGYQSSTIFSQRPGPVYDAMKLACALEGIPTSERRKTVNGKPEPNGCRSFCLMQKNVSRDGFRRQEATTTEDVWCPTTGLGTWVMRQGRNITITGNCMQRYEQGKKAMLRLPWLLQATVASVSCDTLGFKEIDTQLQNWEQRQPADDPQIVVGGVDLVALAPFVPSTGVAVSTVLTVVQNAPVPVLDADPIQLSRDGVDAILAYAQHIASFPMGGADFAVTLPLYEQFEKYCATKNAMYAALGMSRSQMLNEGDHQEFDDPRFQQGGDRGKKTR